MHADNVENMRMASDRYLEECLMANYDKNEGFKDKSLNGQISIETKEEN